MPSVSGSSETERDSLVSCRYTFSINESSYSVANNTSQISWSMNCVCTSDATFYGSSRPRAGKVHLMLNKGSGYSEIDWFTIPLNSGLSDGDTIRSVSSSDSGTSWSGTITVSHNSDGKKTVTFYAYMEPWEDPQNYDYVWESSESNTGSLTLTNIPRQSNVALSTNSYVLGNTEAIGITISRNVSSYVHKLEYSTWAYPVKQEIATNVGTSYSWSFASLKDTMLSQMLATGVTAMSVTVYCTTYSGSTQIGSVTSSSFTLQYIRPSVSLILTRDSATPANVTMVVQGTAAYAFGSAQNTVSLTYQNKMKSANVFPDDPISINATIDSNGQFSATLSSTAETLTNQTSSSYTFNASTAYEFKIGVADSLTNGDNTIYVTEILYDFLPLYAEHKRHLDIYGDLYLHDRTDPTNYAKITPSGFTNIPIIKTARLFSSNSTSISSDGVTNIVVTLPDDFLYSLGVRIARAWPVSRWAYNGYGVAMVNIVNDPTLQSSYNPVAGGSYNISLMSVYAQNFGIVLVLVYIADPSQNSSIVLGH